MKASTKHTLLMTTLCMTLIGVTMAAAAHASPWIDVHLASKHGKDTYYEPTPTPYEWESQYTERKYNSRNYGLGISNRLSENIEWTAGFYKNSYYKTSLYSGVDIHTTDTAPVGYGLSMGIVSGYEDTDQPPVMILPNIRIGNQHVRLKMGVLPVGVKLVTLSVSFKF